MRAIEFDPSLVSDCRAVGETLFRMDVEHVRPRDFGDG